MIFRRTAFLTAVFGVLLLIAAGCTNPFMEQLLRSRENSETLDPTQDGKNPDISWTVTFNSNGGSAVPDQTVADGATASKPADPKKAYTLAAGLYEGTPGAFNYIFDGWYDDPDLTALYDFSTPFTDHITLYAKWEEPANAPAHIDYEVVSANKVAAAVDYMTTLDNAGTFTLLIDQNVEAGTQELYTGFNLTIIGIGAERTIQYTGASNESLFRFYYDSNSLTLGNNITLKGISGSSAPLVDIWGGSLYMKAGSKITGHSTSAAGAVSVSTDDGFFMEGGDISGNTSTAPLGYAAGGVAVSGLFVMSGGTITNNRVGNGSDGDVVIMGGTTSTLSGNARIGVITLLANLIPVTSTSVPITLSGYTNTSQTLIHLSAYSNVSISPADTIAHWTRPGVHIITGTPLNADIINKFTLGGQFFSYENDTASFASAADYYIGTSGTELGRLMRTFTTPLTNIDDIEPYLAYIASQTGDGGATDVPIPLNLSLNLGTMTDTASNWQKILTALDMAGKYVDLDLSACAMDGTEFNPDENVSTGKDKIVSIALPNVATIIADSIIANAYVFSNFTALESVSGGPALTSISQYAFIYCKSLKSISMPGLTSIGENAFDGCESLTSVSMPLVETIGRSAFFECKSLTSISLPSVFSVGNSAFGGCFNLESVTLPALKNLGIQAFLHCSNLERVTLPVELGAIGRGAFDDCSKLTTVICHAVTPPEWYKEDDGSSWGSSDSGYCFFNYATRSSLSIYVPEDSVPDYKSNTDWSLFKDGIFKIEE